MRIYVEALGIDLTALDFKGGSKVTISSTEPCAKYDNRALKVTMKTRNSKFEAGMNECDNVADTMIDPPKARARPSPKMTSALCSSIQATP